MELGQQHRHVIQSPSPRDIAEAFPEECRTVARRELHKWESALKRYYDEYIAPPLKEIQPKDRRLARKFLMGHFPHWEILNELTRRIKHLERIINLADAKHENTPIEEARNYPLLQLCQEMGMDLKKSGRYYTGHCPFHDDRRPSFFVFEDNRFKCFGCQEGGDAIDFVRKKKGLSFREAVNYLGRRGIRNGN